MRKSVLFLSGLLVLCACGGGSSSKIVPVLSVSVTPSAQTHIDEGQTLNFTATVSNDSSGKGVTWTVAGTSCSGSACGTLTNTTTGAATYAAPASLTANMTVTVQATSVADTSKSVSAAVVVSPEPAIMTTSLTGGAVGATYTANLQASGGASTLNWTLDSASSLPAGLSLSSAGVISGMPTTAGTKSFTVKVTDASAAHEGTCSQTKQFSLTIAPAGLSVTTTSLPGAVVDSLYNAPLQAAGGTPPYFWTVASGSSLPTWLALGGSGTNWKLTGTPSAAGTSTFSLTVEDSSTPTAQSKTQSLSVTVAPATTACGTGNESILKGQYAFSLSGYTSSGFLAAIGSFTADGNGHITAGTVDSNGSLGVKTGSVTASGSLYSVGSDNRGCATIVTPFYTFITRFALGTPSANVTPGGAIEEWEPGPSPYIAAGQILLQQTIPAALPSGTWVYEQTGIFGNNQYRTASVGTLTVSGGTFTKGEYDSNVAGVHKTYTGLTGTFTSPDKTTGRYTTATTLSGITVNHAAYLVSSTQYIQLSTEASGSTTAILIADGQLQSGALTIGGKMVFYGSGMNSSGTGNTVQFGLASATGSNALTATVYEDKAGTWKTPNPDTASCSYAIDSYGRVTLSGASCGTSLPVFYLTGPNTGVMEGTDSGVLVGWLRPQSATTIKPGTYFLGTQEAVDFYDETGVGVATLTSTGITGTMDITSYSSPQQADQAQSETLTVGSDGTFSTSDHPGVVVGVVVSNSQSIAVDKESGTYPGILVISTVPLK